MHLLWSHLADILEFLPPNLELEPVLQAWMDRKSSWYRLPIPSTFVCMSIVGWCEARNSIRESYLSGSIEFWGCALASSWQISRLKFGFGLASAKTLNFDCPLPNLSASIQILWWQLQNPRLLFILPRIRLFFYLWSTFVHSFSWPILYNVNDVRSWLTEKVVQ